MARVQTPSHLRREYECVYLINQEHEEPAVDKIIERYSGLVKDQGGKVVRIDNWGKRRLAYPIEKQPKATYIYMQFLASAGLVSELERNMRISEDIVRWLTVLVDEGVDPTARPESTEVHKKVVEEVDARPERRREGYGSRDRDRDSRGPRGDSDNDNEDRPRRPSRSARTEEEEE